MSIAAGNLVVTTRQGQVRGQVTDGVASRRHDACRRQAVGLSVIPDRASFSEREPATCLWGLRR